MREQVRKYLIKLGYVKGSIVLTVLSILLSVIITSTISLVNDGSMSSYAFTIAIVVPLIVAPIMNFIVLHLLYEVEEAREAARLLSITDELTGSFNRRHFIELAERELDRAQRHNLQLALVIFDVDDFKQINDGYGHLCGDEMQRAVSRMCTGMLRQHDIFARYGGDEFVMLLPETGRSGAGGVAALDPDMHTLDDLLNRADQALYRAKGGGKNRVTVG
jgi:PleD family two-component response regulator